MAQTLLQKAKIAWKANMHKLLDKAVNTPDGYKQFIRELEMAMADLRAAVDEAVGTISGHKREIAELQRDIVETQADIDLLLGDDDPSNDEAALQLQLKLTDKEAQVVEIQQMLAEVEEDRGGLEKAIDQLEAKHGEMMNNYRKMVRKTAASKSQNRASAAAEAAQEASNAADGAGVDSIMANIDKQNDVSDARFQRVIGELSNDDDPETAAKLARAKAALAARRAAIGSDAKDQVQTPQDAVPADAVPQDAVTTQ